MVWLRNQFGSKEILKLAFFLRSVIDMQVGFFQNEKEWSFSGQTYKQITPQSAR